MKDVYSGSILLDGRHHSEQRRKGKVDVSIIEPEGAGAGRERGWLVDYWMTNYKTALPGYASEVGLEASV